MHARNRRAIIPALSLVQGDQMQDKEVAWQHFYSTKEVAAICECSMSTIRMAKMNKRIIPMDADSRDTFYTRAQVKAFAETRGINIIYTPKT